MSARRMAPVAEQLDVLMRGADYGDPKTLEVMRAELRTRLEEDRPLRVYCGYDPTSVDLHLGHTITMRKLRQFQRFGHEVTFLIGNFTGLVGDPSDKDSRRPMLSAEQLAANGQTYADQAFRILDREQTLVRYNADWLGDLGFADVIRLASHFTVAQFLERDNFHKRWERGDAVYLNEFMYSIMQAYDAVAMETDVQLGGTDQLFNLMAGRTLQREHGQRPQVVVTVPILVGTDGKLRMSKSTGNYIGVDEPANDIYGKVMSLPDEAMAGYFALVTEVPAEEATTLLAQAANEPMIVKKRLAFEVTASMRDREAAGAAQEYFESTFQRREMPDEMVEFVLPTAAEDCRVNAVLLAAGLAASGGEVRRLVKQGAVRLNDERIDDVGAPLAAGDQLRVGKHRFLRLVAAGGGGE